MSRSHEPVLLNEVIGVLNPQPGEFFIDGTAGSGGHFALVVQRIGSKGTALGIDRDKNAVERLQHKFNLLGETTRIIIEQGNYADLPDILKNKNMNLADCLLLDLGFSREQIEAQGRGFSFLRDEPLDMRYDPDSKIMTAAEVINKLGEEELSSIFIKYGEERYAKSIARVIATSRKRMTIQTTGDLVRIIEMTVRRTRLHPATRVFQALRIYVNRELENLESVLRNLSHIVSVGGRVAVISFHSLEDRIV
ncbi:16S rRNA (cytosine(1402)-N(4))-methyltransferase RsmH, partial [Candidatus Jorgensenbacteria bacterium]|nr:16S rRNA (cytosine(1402)-N(4))-methyltransferase RsmH [Candidatus Jorgensenbacteria bacterium]